MAIIKQNGGDSFEKQETNTQFTYLCCDIIYSYANQKFGGRCMEAIAEGQSE